MEESAQENTYGKIKPLQAGLADGRMAIKIGDRIMVSKTAKTFPEFLQYYLWRCLGRDWWDAQRKLPKAKRSPIYNWAEKTQEYLNQNRSPDQKITCIKPNGFWHAYITLAYDLYVLENHSALQKTAIERLKRTSEFYGARYELLVAATFVRAGFDIRYENERNNSSKHPEFIAIHKATGIQIDVEAKKRNRLKKLTAEQVYSGEGKVAVRDLLAGAVGKFRDRPFVVFLDMDLPFTQGKPLHQPWFVELFKTIEEAGVIGKDGVNLVNMICFTNYPAEEFVNETPMLHRLSCLPPMPKASFKNGFDLAGPILKALGQFGNIPSLYIEEKNDPNEAVGEKRLASLNMTAVEIQ